MATNGRRTSVVGRLAYGAHQGDEQFVVVGAGRGARAVKICGDPVFSPDSAELRHVALIAGDVWHKVLRLAGERPPSPPSPR